MKILHDKTERNHLGVISYDIEITDDFRSLYMFYDGKTISIDYRGMSINATQAEATILHDKLVEARNEINKLRKVKNLDEQPF